MKKLKVALLKGGSSTEREVSLLSADEMLRNLNSDKYEIIPIDIRSDNAQEWVGRLISDPPDVVLSALHGGLGENGAIQGLLECLGIPYVGSKILGSSVGMDKNMSKIIMRAYHIPVADDVFIPRNANIAEYEDKISELGYPLVVKPNSGGSSIGVVIAKDESQFLNAVREVRALDDDIMIEAFIKGQEVTCGVLERSDGLEVLTVLDIESETAFYDYHAKYFTETTKIELSKLPAYLQVMIQEIAKKVFRALDSVGYARVDMIVHEEQVVVLEINTLPGLTSHSLIPRAAKAKDISFSQLLDKLITFELARQ